MGEGQTIDWTPIVAERRRGLGVPMFLRPPTSAVQRAVGRGVGRRAVLIPGRASVPTVRSWLRWLARDRVRVIGPDNVGEWELPQAGAAYVDDEGGTLASALRRIPAPDLVIVLDSPHPRRAFTDAFPTVTRGGRMVVVGAGRPLADWLRARQDRARHSPPGAGRLGLAIDDVTMIREAVIVRSRRTHYFKLSTEETEELLPRREPGTRVEIVTRRSAASIDVDAPTHHGEPAGPFAASLHSPDLALRHYQGTIDVVGRGVVSVGQTLLPDTFRWHLASSRRNNRVRPGPRTEFGRVAARFRPDVRLYGTFYHLDNEFLGHFGHMSTEVVARMWGWRDAKRLHPDLKVLMVHWNRTRGRPTLPEAFLAAYGVAREDIIWVDHPVQVDSLISAMPLWHQGPPYYVHPDLTQDWERLAYGFAGGDPDGGPRHERIFVSRGGLAKNRACRNQKDVEAVFDRHGYEVIYPEDYSLEQQVRIFRHARVVAGFGGSSMFNMMWSHHLERAIVLNSASYRARNEHLLSALLGNDQHYFWSESDHDHPFDPRSSWAFDFGQHDGELNRLLRER